MVESNTNPTIQKVQTEEAPNLAAHRDAIYLSPKLFARVKTVYDQRRTLHVTADREYVVERYYRDFVRAGALLSDTDKNTLRDHPGVIAWRPEMPEALADIDTKDGDIGIADICTRLVQLHLKRRWFLKEIARKDD
jgi:hypothetical protein